MNNPERILQDIRFMIEQGNITAPALARAFAAARLPDVPEIAAAFTAMQSAVLALATPGRASR